MVGNRSRKPGRLTRRRFDSFTFRVYNFTQRLSAGVFRSFLTRKRTGLRANRRSRGGRLHRPPRSPVSHRCGRVPVKHSSSDMGGSIPSAGTVRRYYGSSHWSALRSGIPPDASRVGLVVWIPDSHSGGRGSIPLRGTLTGRHRRKVNALAEPSASGPGASTGSI